MGHHHPGYYNRESGTATRRLWISIALNLVITLAEIVGGILSNSLALISDAIHNLSDTASLGISLVARKISFRKPDDSKTFGYRRAEIIAAFINLVALVIIAFFLIKEGIERFWDPQPIDGGVMFWVALIGLAGNVITAMLLHRDSKSNLNIKSAYIHIFWDAVSSVAVIAGGFVIWFYDIYIVDTIITLLISAYILYHSYGLLRETINILMEATPEDIDVDEIREAIESADHVIDAHHVHVWNLSEKQRLLECHVIIKRSDAGMLEEIKSEIKKLLLERFSIDHSTLEFEFEVCNHKENKACY